MRAWPRRIEALGACVLLSAVLAAQDPAADEVASLFERGRWREAYEESTHIESQLLRAQWRFHVLYAAGNLPDALAAAREGLKLAPDNLELLHNAALCCVTLGLVEASEQTIERWRSAIDTPALAAAQRADWESKLAPLEQATRALRATETDANAASTRARRVIGAGLVLCVALLVALALAPRRRAHAD